MQSSTIKIEENKITTKSFLNGEEIIEVWETKPSYTVGSQYFEFEGNRYFLIRKESKG
jgi:hypothetical protein